MYIPQLCELESRSKSIMSSQKPARTKRSWMSSLLSQIFVRRISGVFFVVRMGSIPSGKRLHNYGKSPCLKNRIVNGQ